MPVILSSRIESVDVQKDGRKRVTEIHTTDNGEELRFCYVAGNKDDYEQMMADRAAALEAEAPKVDSGNLTDEEKTAVTGVKAALDKMSIGDREAVLAISAMILEKGIPLEDLIAKAEAVAAAGAEV